MCSKIFILGPKKLIICFSGVTFNPPPRTKIYFIAFKLINVKNCRHKIIGSIWQPFALFSIGWLVEFWCTRSRDLA